MGVRADHAAAGWFGEVWAVAAERSPRDFALELLAAADGVTSVSIDLIGARGGQRRQLPSVSGVRSRGGGIRRWKIRRNVHWPKRRAWLACSFRQPAGPFPFFASHLMKTILGFLLAAGLAAAVGFAAPRSGQPAPDFTLVDLDGKTHTLSALRGKTVVLEWVNPECPFVVKHYEKSGNMPRLQREATDAGVVWISVNSARPGAQGDYGPAEAKAWKAKTAAAPAGYARDQDGKVGKLYGARATPHLAVIDPQGVLVYQGAIDSIRSSRADDIGSAENYVRSALAAIRDGKAPATTSTNAYGCSIKY